MLVGFRVASVCRAHYTGVYIYSETEGYLHPQFYICTEEVAELSVNDFLSSLSTNALHTAYDVLNEDFLFICTQNFGVKSPRLGIVVAIGFIPLKMEGINAIAVSVRRLLCKRVFIHFDLVGTVAQSVPLSIKIGSDTPLQYPVWREADAFNYIAR